MYVIVRTDLSLSQQLVQSIHAAIEAYRQQKISDQEPHPSLVVCGIPNERQLLSTFTEISSTHIPVTIFREPDLENQATAIATGLLEQKDRKHFRKLKLLRLEK